MAPCEIAIGPKQSNIISFMWFNQIVIYLFFLNLFIYGCVGSSFLCEDFL